MAGLTEVDATRRTRMRQLFEGLLPTAFDEGGEGEAS